jgi:hypothetical protein
MCRIPGTHNGSKSMLRYKCSLPTMHRCCDFSSEFLQLPEWEQVGEAFERMYVTNPQEH